MPCHVPSTSVSRRRSPRFPSSPPKITAVLDLDKPGERAAHDLIRRVSSGRWPMWRLLGMRRREQVLIIAVEWVRSRSAHPYSLIELSLVELALRWRDFSTAADVLAVLAVKPRPPAASVAPALYDGCAT
jgi:hypothetical protein